MFSVSIVYEINNSWVKDLVPNRSIITFVIATTVFDQTTTLEQTLTNGWPKVDIQNTWWMTRRTSKHSVISEGNSRELYLVLKSIVGIRDNLANYIQFINNGSFKFIKKTLKLDKRTRFCTEKIVWCVSSKINLLGRNKIRT